MDIKFISGYDYEWFDLDQCTILYSDDSNLLFDNISEKWILNINNDYKYISDIQVKEWKKQKVLAVA